MNRKMIRLLIAVIVLITGYLSQSFNPNTVTTMDQATITKHVDGDTVMVEIDDQQETIRLIGVDTPEIDGPYTDDEPYGKEASLFTKETLPLGTTVYLEKDVSNRDKHDRLLRYLWLRPVEDTSNVDVIRDNMFNAMLIAGGYAEVKTYEPDTAYNQIFQTLEDEAMANGEGMHQ